MCKGNKLRSKKAVVRETLKVSSTMYQNLSLGQIINFKLERIPLHSSLFLCINRELKRKK